MTTKRFAFLMLFLPTFAFAQNHSGNHGSAPSLYAGQETRLIKSLSEDDVEEIARGGGWGLARAAELNGVPGPTHLLELADQIGLTEQQRDDIEVIRAQMRADAITAGERFVAAHQSRLAHLNAHLLTLPLLTDTQVTQYSVLRGYSDDPCDAVPDGHDPKMWRNHNGCN